MANINIVLLAGNLTRDPEIRYTPSGMAVAALGLAVNRKFKDTRTNELREEVTFVDVEVFGRQAEVAGQYLSKGRPVMIEGRLKLDQWEDKQTGQKRSKLKVIGNRVQFLGGPGGAGGGAPGAGAGQPGAATPARQGARPLPPRPQANRAQEEAPPQAPPEGGGGEADLEIPEDDIPF